MIDCKYLVSRSPIPDARYSRGVMFCRKHNLALSTSCVACNRCKLGNPPTGRTIKGRERQDVLSRIQPKQKASVAAQKKSIATNGARPVCIHRGASKGHVKASCCGMVEVFDCVELKREVWATKCKSCKRYAAPPRAITMSDRPTVSVCVNTANEGGRVWSTIQDLDANLCDMPREFLVGADGVTDGCCDDLGGAAVVTHAESEGCGKTKAELLSASRGAVVLHADAHQAVFRGSLASMVKHAETHNAIVTPLLGHLDYDAAWNPIRAGVAEFAPRDHAILLDDGGQYRVADDADKRNPSRVLMPSCVTVASRVTWDAIGGWNKYEGVLGYQELGLALRAYMAKVPVVLWPTVLMGHEFQRPESTQRSKRPYRPRPSKYASNVWHAFMVVMSPKGFGKHIRPRLLSDPSLATGRVAEENPVVLAEREHYLTHCRKRNDNAVARLMSQLASTLPTKTGA